MCFFGRVIFTHCFTPGPIPPAAAPPSAKVQRHNWAQWGWEICLSQGEANPNGGPLVERLEKYIFCSETLMSQGQSSWYVSNTECYETYLFKTKIRRVELSPTVSQMWKMFSHVHREETLQSSMAIPKKRKETKMLQTCMTSISRSLVGESNPSMETSTRVFLSLQTPQLLGAFRGVIVQDMHLEKVRVLFGINPGDDEDEPWFTSWLGSKCFLYLFGSMQEVSLQVPGLFSIATPNDLEETLRFFVRLDR